MAESIAQLRIYTSARALEDQVYDLVKKLPPESDYPLGNNLRRASAAVCYHISEAHRRYSYTLKLECLSAARDAAETTQKLLIEAKSHTNTDELVLQYTGVIKQSWGLIRYLKQKRQERGAATAVRAKEEQVAARA